MCVLLQMAFTTTNKGMVKIGFFLLNCPNPTVNVRVSLFQNIILWQYDLLINKSNQFAVIVFHQSATGDTRESLDQVVERQKHV